MSDEAPRISRPEETAIPIARGFGAAWLAACIATDVMREAERVGRHAAGRSSAKASTQSPDSPTIAAPIRREAR